ncbi:MAG: DUF2332 family protein [Paracoccaceae bacterium]|nr:MAG: DUF2332 family protein [Paracoccaceae bacterium]
MSAAIRDAFRAQARACAALGSALTARLLDGLAAALAADTATGRRVLRWQGDPSASGDAVALRLAGGLHALVLSGRDAGLAAAYATGEPVAAAMDAIARHDAFLLRWLDSPPQTNEVRRSAALIAAAHWLHARHPLPLLLSEPGASAGLNLIWDRYALVVPGASCGPADAVLTLAPEWRGAAPPAAAAVRIAGRAGADLNPLDPAADRLRLMSYVWADQHDRLARTARAADEAARLRPPVARADAVDWLAERLAEPRPGQLHLIQHSVMWQYLSAEAQARGDAVIAAAGARATSGAPMARVAMEADGDGPGAALTVTVWPGGVSRALARVDFHGRWIDWRSSPG